MPAEDDTKESRALSVKTVKTGFDRRKTIANEESEKLQEQMRLEEIAKKAYYKDAFFYRYIDDQKDENGKMCKYQVKSQEEFQKDTNIRSGDNLWKTLSSISLTPISKYGLGKLISFEFFAPSVGHDLKDGMLQYYGQIKFDYE